MDRLQLITARAGKFGIEGKHLDREVDFVDDSLARRLPFGPQFEVVGRVVQAISVPVVDIFAFLKRSSKRLGHKYAVLKRFSSASEMQSPVSGRVDVPLGIDWAPTAAFVSAVFRAETLSFVVARMLAVFGFAKSTFFRLSTKLTLKRGWRSFVHEHMLAQSSCLSNR